MSRRGFLGTLAATGAFATMQTNSVVAQAANPSGLTVSGDQFLLDGKPFRIMAGSAHYFRIHPDLWRDRLLRLRAMGLNTVDTYIAWNFHEPTRGDVDFSGWRDISTFIRTAEEVGLKVVVRPGPYVCTEWDLGGFPAWLLDDPNFPLRCAEPEFERLVERWFSQLIPRLTNLQATRGGPIIAFQVENEYGSFGNDQAHLEHLKASMTRHGVDSLMFCCNGPSDYMLVGGNLPDTLATVNFAGAPQEPFAALRDYQPRGPLWCTEYWNGWFDHWGEQHNTTDPAEEAKNVDSMLSMGASFSLYMAHGGTNFGLSSGANYDDDKNLYQPTITSYDYDAPVGEAGELTAKFHRIREVIGKHERLPDMPLPALPARLPAQTVRPNKSVSLMDSLDALSVPVRQSVPVHMERLGQPHGLIHYRARVQGPRETAGLSIRGLADRALVFHNSEFVGTLERNKPDQTIDIAVDGKSATIDILVDTGGRINFGQKLNDPKGISDRVLLGAQALFNWEIRPLPLDDLSALRYQSTNASAPAFHSATMRINETADGFLALPGWGKGLLWLNGFLLGRYWDIGPQRTLYAPSPLWRNGDNELIVLELHKAGSAIELRNGPDLG